MRSTDKQDALTLPLLWFYELGPQETQSLLLRLLLRENAEKPLAPLPGRTGALLYVRNILVLWFTVSETPAWHPDAAVVAPWPFIWACCSES